VDDGFEISEEVLSIRLFSSYIKMKILFQPITTTLKRPVHHTYRAVIGCR